ncbi:MAG TPA: hypothetical protein VKL21_10310, partial [Candidatus Methanoperedens sp.]|nr:hypothetical protein [Candidatus Methanoperedens sp.]
MPLKPVSELVAVMHWKKENVECDLYDVKENIPTKSPDPGRIVSDSFNSPTPIGLLMKYDPFRILDYFLLIKP